MRLATAVCLVAEKVREMDNASNHARGWMEPTTCGVGPDAPTGCMHSLCIARAAHWSAYWAQLAARSAITLESLVGCGDEYWNG